MPLVAVRSTRFIAGCTLFAVVAAIFFLFLMQPLGVEAGPRTFSVYPGDRFRDIADRLAREGFIRSSASFKLLALFGGVTSDLKPGDYVIESGERSGTILLRLVRGPEREATVVIPEGASVYDINDILSKAGVLAAGSLVERVHAQGIEGKLFPDTYKFFYRSTPAAVIRTFLDNFARKAAPLLSSDPEKMKEQLILASLIEREVPDHTDRRIVAGILTKRLDAGMGLQVDATICYIKRARNPVAPYDGCHPLAPLDFKVDSPYNTYLYKGLPPEPIGSPGLSSLRAVLSPIATRYWFYLSDPVTKKTIWSETFEEHSNNRNEYLLKR